MYQLRTPSHKIFCKSENFKIKYCKIFHCRLHIISLHYQTVVDERLTVFHQLFSWTSVGPSKYLIDKMIGPQSQLRVWAIPWMPCVLSENSPQKFFWKSWKFKIRHCKNFNCLLKKISLHYQTVIDQRLTVFHQLFSWTSVGPSKCPSDKWLVRKAICESKQFLECYLYYLWISSQIFFESH